MADWKEIRELVLSGNSESVLPPSLSLPILPKALNDFRSKAQEPDPDPDELTRIISSDAGLCTELLRNVNTSKSAARTKITSVKQALVMLGIRATLLHLTTSGMKEVMKSTASKLINFQNFWNTNLERSLFAREIAKLLKADTDLAFTAGMLQDFLLPLITSQLCDDYMEFTGNRNAYQNVVAFERNKFGWDHGVAAAQVMHAWHFPDELVCCVFYHHHGLEILKDEKLKGTAAAAVAISSLLPDALRQETNGMEKLIELETEWPELELLNTAERISEEFKEMTNNAKNHFSFLRVYQNAIKRLELNQETST